MRPGVVRSSLLLIVLLVVAAVAAAGWGVDRFSAPGPPRAQTTLVLPPGIGVDEIARRLHAAGVIERPLLFRIGVRVSGRGRHLRAGEYAFAAAISPRAVMELLVAGRTVVRRITVPEGLTSAEIVALLRAAEGLVGGIAAIPAEGALLPETYHYSFGDGRAALLARMRAAMREVLAESWHRRADGLPYATSQEALVLASIVEKETGAAAERAHVAGVFVNRLRRGMRLQSDPTVAYAVSGGRGPLKRALTRADLAIDSPYNTYRIAGLPPAPIANPGRAAIEAVMAPLATEDFYFVADGSGGHAFAATLREHLRNVAKLRRLQRSRRR